MPKRRNNKRKATGEYDVENIIDHRINSDTLRAQFCVKWKGYSKEANTWEPMDHVYKLPILLHEYIEKKKAY